MLAETGETAAIASQVLALSDANKVLLLSGHRVTLEQQATRYSAVLDGIKARRREVRWAEEDAKAGAGPGAAGEAGAARANGRRARVSVAATSPVTGPPSPRVVRYTTVPAPANGPSSQEQDGRCSLHAAAASQSAGLRAVEAPAPLRRVQAVDVQADVRLDAHHARRIVHAAARALYRRSRPWCSPVHDVHC